MFMFTTNIRVAVTSQLLYLTEQEASCHLIPQTSTSVRSCLNMLL